MNTRIIFKKHFLYFFAKSVDKKERKCYYYFVLERERIKERSYHEIRY
nr:MAG TPA: hypothetical protein [Bacteriophage sp.]DAN62997.1 MAG TPA: hypothetical protein [Caudoviricetes sp.]